MQSTSLYGLLWGKLTPTQPDLEHHSSKTTPDLFPTTELHSVQSAVQSAVQSPMLCHTRERRGWDKSPESWAAEERQPSWGQDRGDANCFYSRKKHYEGLWVSPAMSAHEIQYQQYEIHGLLVRTQSQVGGLLEVHVTLLSAANRQLTTVKKGKSHLLSSLSSPAAEVPPSFSTGPGAADPPLSEFHLLTWQRTRVAEMSCMDRIELDRSQSSSTKGRGKGGRHVHILSGKGKEGPFPLSAAPSFH